MPSSPEQWEAQTARVERLKALFEACGSKEEREAFLRALDPSLVLQLSQTWRFRGRPKQIEPAGDWSTWLVLAGRGFGKTRMAAEWVVENIVRGKARKVALVGNTAHDYGNVMVPAIIDCCPSWLAPHHIPGRRQVLFSNGAVAYTYSAVEPEQLRGPEHDLAWVDELAKFRYDEETWGHLQLGLRVPGSHPRTIVTTTPKPTKLVKELAARGKDSADPYVVLTVGSTFENVSLPDSVKAEYKKLEGTRFGRQELEAEILEDVQGALWSYQMIEAGRSMAKVEDVLPTLKRIVVAIDPSGTKEGDECGIIVAGLGHDDKGYIIHDGSGQLSPNQWAQQAVELYHQYKADRIVAETNFGADMVEALVRSVDASVSFKKVTATRGKAKRAEPVAALYEQGKVHHVGAFPELETQMTSWVPGETRDSPDRADALVWALTELMVKEEEPKRYVGYSSRVF